jgi:hypothetical protein
LTLDGSSNIITGADGGTLMDYSAHDTIGLSSGTIDLGSTATDATVTGSSDSVFLQNGGAVALSGSSDTVALSAGTITLDSSTASIIVDGTGNMIDGNAARSISSIPGTPPTSPLARSTSAAVPPTSSSVAPATRFRPGQAIPSPCRAGRSISPGRTTM